MKRFIPLSTSWCCWLCEPRRRRPGTRRGEPAWWRGEQSWTRCCTVAWQPRTFCCQSIGQPPNTTHHATPYNPLHTIYTARNKQLLLNPQPNPQKIEPHTSRLWARNQRIAARLPTVTLASTFTLHAAAASAGNAYWRPTLVIVCFPLDVGQINVMTDRRDRPKADFGDTERPPLSKN